MRCHPFLRPGLSVSDPQGITGNNKNFTQAGSDGYACVAGTEFTVTGHSGEKVIG